MCPKLLTSTIYRVKVQSKLSFVRCHYLKWFTVFQWQCNWRNLILNTLKNSSNKHEQIAKLLDIHLSDMWEETLLAKPSLKSFAWISCGLQIHKYSRPPLLRWNVFSHFCPHTVTPKMTHTSHVIYLHLNRQAWIPSQLL